MRWLQSILMTFTRPGVYAFYGRPHRDIIPRWYAAGCHKLFQKPFVLLSIVAGAIADPVTYVMPRVLVIRVKANTYGCN
jgi:hypothetical protein